MIIGFALLLGDQIVHDLADTTLIAPAPFVFATAMLQIQDRIARLVFTDRNPAACKQKYAAMRRSSWEYQRSRTSPCGTSFTS